MEELLTINNLRKGFGGLEVLKDISLHVEKGQVVAIIGLPAPANQHCCAVRRCLKRSTKAQFAMGQTCWCIRMSMEKRYMPIKRLSKKSVQNSALFFKILTCSRISLC